MTHFENLIKRRRSVYHLNTKVDLTQMQIMNLIRECVKECPTAFNSQSARIVVLFGESYQNFWQLVENKLKTIVSEEKFSATKLRLDSFKSGIGTVLFFEDMSVVQELQQKMPTYKDNFPLWAEQSNAILQYMIWTALQEHHIGASLQHYNPLIDDEVKKIFKIPHDWRLIAQMPFGGIAVYPSEKTYLPIDERVRIFE